MSNSKVKATGQTLRSQDENVPLCLKSESEIGKTSHGTDESVESYLTTRPELVYRLLATNSWLKIHGRLRCC